MVVDAERARLAVTKNVKAVVKRLGASHPALAHHLATSVRTGTFCGYRPPPGREPIWRF
jgi:hypothetical protein